MSAPRDYSNVPKSAMTFDVGGGACTFQRANESGNYPVRLLARSGQPIEHWWWGRVVHDLSGMFIPGDRDRVPLDWCHRQSEVLGFGKPEEKDADLWVEGELTPFQEDDLPTEIAHKGQAGVPYQASIDFYGDGIIVEELGVGASAQVNGYTLEGPATIVREWPLRGVALCLYGADQNTASQFSRDDDGQSVAVHLLNRENDMADDTPQTDTPAEAAQLSKEELLEQAGKLGLTLQEDGESEGDKSRLQYNAELKRFTDKFGSENGNKWFTDNKTYEEAMEFHADALEAEVKRLTAEVQKHKDKLASLDGGEAEPVDSEPTDKKGAGFASRLTMSSRN